MTKRFVLFIKVFLLIFVISFLYWAEYKTFNQRKDLIPTELKNDLFLKDKTFNNEEIIDEDKEDYFSLEKRYVRNFLNEKEKQLYDSFLVNSLKHISSFNIIPIKEESLQNVYRAFMNDNPDHFWVDNLVYYTNSNTNQVIKIDFKFNVDEKEKEKRQEEIDQVVKEILAPINKEMTEYDQVKYIYDYIIDNTIYDYQAPDNQNIYSVLINGRSVCAGYARTFQYLMNKLDIFNLYVTGTTTTEDNQTLGHAWNLVRLDNQFYNIDSTWGNSIFITDQSLNNYKNYHYFNVTSEEIKKTHIFDAYYPLPEAKGLKYNYYIKEKLLFTVYDLNLENRLYERLIEINEEKDPLLTISFTNKKEYQKALEQLFDKGKLFKLIKQSNKSNKNKVNERIVKSSSNEEKLIIDIYLNYI
ncbi:MAG: transglutaminase domain-containing protein [Bacilli bacterium]|jgi:hypothetical protein